MKKCIAICAILLTMTACTTGQKQATGIIGGAAVGGLAGSALTGGSAGGAVAGAVLGGVAGSAIADHYN